MNFPPWFLTTAGYIRFITPTGPHDGDSRPFSYDISTPNCEIFVCFCYNHNSIYIYDLDVETIWAGRLKLEDGDPDVIAMDEAEVVLYVQEDLISALEEFKSHFGGL